MSILKNARCDDMYDICVFCTVGDWLADDDECPFEMNRREDYCPAFQCAEQCRLCHPDCPYLGK